MSDHTTRNNAPFTPSRRDFFRTAGCATLTTLALSSQVYDLRLINAAMADVPPNDYKALVCIFLYGGNDANNLLIPNDSFYSQYAGPRANLAIPQASLLPSPRPSPPAASSASTPTAPASSSSST